MLFRKSSLTRFTASDLLNVVLVFHEIAGDIMEYDYLHLAEFSLNYQWRTKPSPMHNSPFGIRVHLGKNHW